MNDNNIDNSNIDNNFTIFGWKGPKYNRLLAWTSSLFSRTGAILVVSGAIYEYTTNKRDFLFVGLVTMGITFIFFSLILIIVYGYLY